MTKQHQALKTWLMQQRRTQPSSDGACPVAHASFCLGRQFGYEDEDVEVQVLARLVGTGDAEERYAVLMPPRTDGGAPCDRLLQVHGSFLRWLDTWPDAVPSMTWQAARDLHAKQTGRPK